MKSLLAVVVLAGLPLVAAADDASGTQCVQVAEKFSSNPRGLEIAELDQLKTCINLQMEAMSESMPRLRTEVVMARRLPRASLRDDL